MCVNHVSSEGPRTLLKLNDANLDSVFVKTHFLNIDCEYSQWNEMELVTRPGLKGWNVDKEAEAAAAEEKDGSEDAKRKESKA